MKLKYLKFENYYKLSIQSYCKKMKSLAQKQQKLLVILEGTDRKF